MRSTPSRRSWNLGGRSFVRPHWRLCLLLTFSLLATPQPASAALPRWSQVTITSQGVRLTLSVRHRSYPQNALVRVWARMENLAKHDIFLYDPGPQAAGKYIPQAAVLAAPGGQPLPISLTHYMPFPGPAPSSFPLRARAVRNLPELVILRGAYLRLDLTLAAAGKQLPARQGKMISTPLLHVSLTAPDTPSVTLHTPPDQPSATITPAGPVHGPLLAVWYFPCSGDFFSSALQDRIYWSAIARHIIPPCSPITGWHEIAGWLNHSVAEIDWGER